MSIVYKPLRAGIWKGNPIMTDMRILDAEYVYGGMSGRFFTISSGQATICTDTSQTIAGWLESETIAATSGHFRPAVLYDATVQFVLPCYTGTAYTAALVGTNCDLVVSSNIQYADLGTSTHDLLIIVDGYAGDAAADSYVVVQMNANEFYVNT